MSNYPAGVTGNEPQIVGGYESMIWAKCENTVAEGLDWYHGRVAGPTGDFDVECGWEGTLDVVLDESEDEWVGPCPACDQQVRVDARKPRTRISRRRSA